MNRPTRALALFLGLACAGPLAAAQDTGGDPPPPPRRSSDPSPGTGGPRTPPQGSAREAMWRAPTEEDWRKPVLLTFQRTWEDALAVAKEEGKPILVCVNMDGEIASEHYAGVRYRQPDIAALYRPYVCVIASVYRHNTRDHDDAGNRILCPRFGSVTCGEHIAIEPVLYEKYFDGVRVAPRHVLVEVGGDKDMKESFDVYYANDTASVFQAITDGAKGRPAPREIVRGDRPVVERVASREISDRTAVENAWRDGDEAQRRALLEAAAKHPEAAPLELQRLALFSLDPALAAEARRSLATADSVEALPLITDALRTPMKGEDRDALLGALDRMGEKSPKARWLSVVHRGIAGRSETVDLDAWSGAGATYEAPPGAGERPAAEAGGADADDGPANLARAEAFLRQAMEARHEEGPQARAGRNFAKLLFVDARRAALRAAEQGEKGWRTDAVLCIAAYYDGDLPEAYRRAEPAVKGMPPGERGWNAWAALTIFAEGRWKDIKAAVKEKRKWPPSWLADLNAAFTVLRRHPLGTDAQVAWHAELLSWLGFDDRAAAVIEEGLERFQGSEVLHARIRRRVLEKESPLRLEAVYAAMMAKEDRPRGLEVFAAIASTEAADVLRRGEGAKEAFDAYGRAIGYWDRAVADDPFRRDAFDAAAALCHAARARLAFMRDDDEGALAEILASFERRPEAAGDRDGAGITPGETAQVLLHRLRERKKDGDAVRLESVMRTLDPELLKYDR